MNLHLTPERPDVCSSFVLLFTIFIIVITQKLVLQHSKYVKAKCTETLLPTSCIQFSLCFIVYTEYTQPQLTFLALVSLDHRRFAKGTEHEPKTLSNPHTSLGIRECTEGLMNDGGLS